MPRRPTYGVVCGDHNAEKLELARRFRQAPTEAELILWDGLRGNRLNGLHFRRQQVIDGLVADFYCHASALVVEVDGPIHESQNEQDTDREAILHRREILVLRFTNERVLGDILSVLQEIAVAAAERT